MGLGRQDKVAHRDLLPIHLNQASKLLLKGLLELSNLVGRTIDDDAN